MHFSTYDRNQSILVVRLFGARLGQLDYDQTGAETVALIENARLSGQQPLKVIVVGKECAPPNAEQRKQLATFSEMATGLGFVSLLVTPSPLVRGVATAINWIRPQPQGTRVTVVSDQQAAIRWLAKHRVEQVTAAALLMQDLELQVVFAVEQKSA
jgi:hypothetical protein